jgi:GNAT superfamily N-acetyltransferase
VILFFFYVVGICFFGVVTVFLVVGFQFQAFHKGKCVGTVVCKMGDHRNSTFRGYIAMLVVIKPYRGRGIGNGFFFFFLEVNIY